jgi:hypothetical protein
MSATYNPFGLQPSLHESGILRPAPTPGTIASGYANNIFMNAPVQIDSGTPSGNLILVTAQGNAAAVAANRLIGSFQGVEYTLTSDGRRHVSNNWPANTVATNIVAWYTRDPNMTYVIQANGSVLATQLGSQGSITTNGSANGNTTTGFSTVGLDTTTLIPNPPGSGTTATIQQLRIVGFDQGIANAPGDAYTVVQVKIAEHQDVANQIPY